jgi:hypothetical protein
MYKSNYLSRVCDKEAQNVISYTGAMLTVPLQAPSTGKYRPAHVFSQIFPELTANFAV